MKNIILQHFDGELGELEKLSIDNICRYAETVGAEYKLIRGKPFRNHMTPPCQKVHMISKEFDEYDNVLMLDIDMFAPNGMDINVFKEPGVGIYTEVQKRLRQEIYIKYNILGSLDAPYWGGAIYKIGRELRQSLRQSLEKDDSWLFVFNYPYNYEDEGIIHVLAHRSGVLDSPDLYLDRKWCQCSFLPNPENAGFIHIRTKITPDGPKRLKIENYNALVESGIL